jgi:DNA end-binding protein Ku
MPKRARTYWKGFLRLSLVSIAVEVYNAVESKSDISFRQIHKPSGRRVNYQKIVQGIGEIDSADIVKGYEVEPDTYVTLEPDEIDAVKLESRKTIDLVQFVDAKDIDYRFFERPYFLVPADELAGEMAWLWKCFGMPTSFEASTTSSMKSRISNPIRKWWILPCS